MISQRRKEENRQLLVLLYIVSFPFELVALLLQYCDSLQTEGFDLEELGQELVLPLTQ